MRSLLQASPPAHFPGEDVEAHVPKVTQQSWDQKPQGSGFWSPRFSGAPWGTWTASMPHTGSEGRGLEPVHIQWWEESWLQGDRGGSWQGPGTLCPSAHAEEWQGWLLYGHTGFHRPTERDALSQPTLPGGM